VACPQSAGRALVEASRPSLCYSNILVDCHNVNPGIPVSFWRSVGYSKTHVLAESFS